MGKAWQRLSRIIWNMHFDLPKYFLDQLKKPSALKHSDDLKSASWLLLTIMGESPWMRKYMDKPSQIANSIIKEEILKPTSDLFLKLQTSFDRLKLVEWTIESKRKDRRFAIRAL